MCTMQRDNRAELAEQLFGRLSRIGVATFQQMRQSIEAVLARLA